MDKNTITAIVLSTIVIIAGFTAQSIFFPSAPVPETATTEQVNEAVLSEPAVNSPEAAVLEPTQSAITLETGTVV